MNIANFSDIQADLYADDPQANEEWTAKYQEVGADKTDKELERTVKPKIQGQ